MGLAKWRPVPMAVVLALFCALFGVGGTIELPDIEFPSWVGELVRRMPLMNNPLEGHYDDMHPIIKRVVGLGELFQTFQLNRRYDGGFGLDTDLVTRGLMQMFDIFGEHNLTVGCKSSLQYVVPSVMKIFEGYFPLWIPIMLDATGKYPMGGLRGSGLRKGNYDQCIDVDLRPDATPNKLPYPGIEDGFTGQFCTVTGEYGPPNSRPISPDAVLLSNRTRDIFDLQVCIPSVCNTDDAKTIVDMVATIFFDNYTAIDATCHYPKEKRISSWTSFIIAILVSLALCLVIGTIYEIWLGFKLRKKPVENWLAPNDARHAVTQVYEPGAWGKLALCFSIPRNMGNILDRGDKQDPDELSFIHGIKFFCILWLVGVNLLLDSRNRRWENSAGMLEDLHTYSMHIFINGRFLAETAFCVSGFLVSFLMLKELVNQQGNYNTFYHYIHRFWRLVPAYMITMLTTSGIYWYSTDGPDWMTTNEFEDSCKSHGWKGLLMINNFFTNTDSCPPLSWFIATDFQLHLTAPLLIYPIFRRPRLGYILLGIVTICLMAIPPLVTGIEKLPYFIGRLFFLEPKYEDYLDLILYKPWTHAGPFIMGILFGSLVSRYSSQTNKLNLGVAIIGWLVAICIIIVIMLGFHPYIDGTSKMPVVMGIMYTTLAPTLWALAIGWILFSCAIGNGGILTHMLSWELFSPFSRLMYSTFLLNGLVIRHFFDSRPDSFYYDAWMMIVLWLGVLFFTQISAVILSTAVERPFMELEKVLLGYRRGMTGVSVIHLNSDDDDDDDDDVLSVDELATKQGKMSGDYLTGKAAFANSDQTINLINSRKSSQTDTTHPAASNGKS